MSDVRCVLVQACDVVHDDRIKVEVYTDGTALVTCYEGDRYCTVAFGKEKLLELMNTLIKEGFNETDNNS